MKVNLVDYPSLYRPFSRYMAEHYNDHRFLSAAMSQEVLLEQFGVRCSIDKGAKLWHVNMTAEDYLWFKLKWA